VTATKPLGTYGNAVGTVTPADHKAAQSGLIAKTSLNAVRAGLFWGGTANILTAKPNMSYDVAPFTAALSRGATFGTVLMSNDGTLNVATTAAPGSNSRIDIIYVWAREYSLDGVDSNPVIGVVQGTAAASPTAPSLASFPGAIELGRATVGAGITATTSATITQTAPFTAMAGGVIAFRNSTERGLGTYQEGQLGWLMDTDTLEVFNGASWVSKITTSLQTDTTNSTESSYIQSGIGKMVGTNAISIAESVTFPIPFTAMPRVVLSPLGARATGAFNSSGLSADATYLGSAQAPSTTSFTAAMHRPGSTFGSANDFYYSWIAVGPI
jgi:hypothetical protein